MISQETIRKQLQNVSSLSTIMTCGILTNILLRAMYDFQTHDSIASQYFNDGAYLKDKQS